jgi:hypothetical protein
MPADSAGQPLWPTTVQKQQLTQLLQACLAGAELAGFHNLIMVVDLQRRVALVAIMLPVRTGWPARAGPRRVIPYWFGGGSWSGVTCGAC